MENLSLTCPIYMLAPEVFTMSLELEQWLLEEYKEGLKEGEDRVAALFKRM